MPQHMPVSMSAATPVSRRSFVTAASTGIACAALGAASVRAARASEAADDPSAVSGTFVGRGYGMGGEVRMEVTLAGGRMTRIKAQRNYETEGLTDLTFEVMPQEMIANQSYEVDVISGATFSGNAIKTAVRDALEQAGVAEQFATPVERTYDTADEAVGCEYVVVGGGGAGLAAAVTLAQRGKDVVVVEKMPRLGGNTLVCGALMNAYDPVRSTSPDDTVEAFAEWTWEGGNEAGKMDVIETFAEQSWPTTQWLTDEVGVVFYQDLWGSWGHMPVLPNGCGFIYPLVNRVGEYGVPVHLECSLQEILMEDGRAIGVRAEKAGGATLTVNASQGVILATGGLGANLEMVKELDSRYENVNLSTNPVNATGECFAIAEAAGANLINMDSIQAVHFAEPVTGQVDWDCETTNTIFVNKEGRRFMNEEMPRDDSVAGLSQQTDMTMYTIGDAQDWPTMDTLNSFGVTIGDCLARNKAVRADTLEELAETLGIDAEGLVAQVEEYNAMVDAGEDTAFQLETMASRHRIEQAPFYASTLTVAIHYTNGGIEIDPQAHVLDANGEAIPGLYAAGECTGGVMGTNRMGGNSVADVMIFGHIAGQAQ